ncbi:MAG: 5-(carboxyamino)imidazole ribonucleotide mutase [Gammaproteobacteria bacterium]
MTDSAVDPQVSIVMGSKSDLRVMQAAADTLAAFEVAYELDIVSAHRTPDKLHDYAGSVAARGIRVVIAGAGGAAHLPGMIAAKTIVPVIGVPVAATKLDGMDSLLSIVQMPAGVPVATVAIDNAENAALLAVQIVAVADERVRERLLRHKRALEEKVLNAAAELGGTAG